MHALDDWAIDSHFDPSGLIFSIQLPITDDSGTNGPVERLKPFNITFTATDASFGVKKHFVNVAQRAADGSDPAWLLDVTLPAAVIAANWSAVVAEYLDSLNFVRSGMPLSFLPVLGVDPATNQPFVVSFTLIDRTLTSVVLEEQCRFRDPASPVTEGCLNILPRTIEPQGPISCTATFPNIFRTDGQPLVASLQIDKLPPGQDRAGYCFSLQHTFIPYQPVPVGQSPVRMGAMNVLLPNATGSTTLQISRSQLVQMSFRPVIGSTNGDDTWSTAQLENLDFALAVASISAGGQDDVEGDEYVPQNQPYVRSSAGTSTNGRRAPALVWQDSSNFPSTGDYLILDVAERCYEFSSQTLDLKLSQQRLTNPVASPLSLFVIDPEPLRCSCRTISNYCAKQSRIR